MNVGFRSDFANPACWPLRDGVTSVAAIHRRGGVPTLRVVLAGTPESKWRSRYIRRDPFDLKKQTFMDFYLRTTSKDPVAWMFHVELITDK